MSSELKIDSSTQIISTKEKDIIFKINKKVLLSSQSINNIDKNNLNDNILTSEFFIKIENISNNFVALRVRTTKKYSYAVEPVYGIISPNSFIIIKIFYFTKPGEKISSEGHKFKFEGFIIKQNEEKNFTNIYELIQQYIKEQKTVKGNIIKKDVFFEYDDHFIITSKGIHMSFSSKYKNKDINSNITLNDSDKNIINLKAELEQEIRQCNELISIHKKLIKQLNGKNIDENFYLNKNKYNIKEYIKELKEILYNIKNNKLYLIGIIILFLISSFIGFYLNK